MLKLLTCAGGHFWESADEASRCPECGALAEALPMLDLAPLPQETPAPVSRPETPLVEPGGRPVVPGYDILEELARGPTGIRRFRAKQPLVNREVMLEIVLAREDSTQRAWSSLRSEAGLLGKLKHPHILTIHEAGDRDRQLFYNAVEFIAGPTLAEKLGDRSPATDQILHLVEILARAVDHAHRHDVLHRHLEPAKVLLQPEKGGKNNTGALMPGGAVCALDTGQFIPRIVGFGLPRRPIEGDPTDADLYTDPGFLSPEQAWGRTRELGPATDVYGLGGILYFLLTGRAPFRGPTLGDILDAIQTAPLTPLSEGRRVSADLEFVCTKALSRQPRHRYASAAEFADDLRRLSLNLPPLDAPKGSSLTRWIRRSPLVASLLLVTLLGIGGTILGYQRGRRDGKRADVSEYKARAELGKAELELQQLRQQLEEVHAREKYDAYKQKLDRVVRALASNNTVEARIHLESCPVVERRFEWYYLKQRVFSRDAVKVTRKAGTWSAFAVHPREPRFLALAGQGTGTGADHGEVQLWDLSGPRSKLTHPLPGNPVQALAFSPSGHGLAAAAGSTSGTLFLFDLQAGNQRLHQRARTSLGKERLTSVAWNPVYPYIVAATGRGRMFQVEQNLGQPVRGSFGHERAIENGSPRSKVLYRRDGQMLACFTTSDADLQQWPTHPGGAHPPCRGPGNVLAVAYGEKNLLAVARSDDSVYLHDSPTATEVGRIENLPKPILRIAFSNDGQRLAVACENGPIRVYGKYGRSWHDLLDVPGDAAVGLAFSANSRALATANEREAVIFGTVTE